MHLGSTVKNRQHVRSRNNNNNRAAFKMITSVFFHGYFLPLEKSKKNVVHRTDIWRGIIKGKKNQVH